MLADLNNPAGLWGPGPVPSCLLPDLTMISIDPQWAPEHETLIREAVGVWT